jgi:hypothetical protein
MHRPRHAFTIRNFRIAAFLLCIKRFLIVAALATLIVSLLRQNFQEALVSLGVLGLALLLSFVQWIFAAGAKCPLCMMPVLSRKGCSRHRNAKALLGSQRLRVACSILLKGSFRCPYCNEPTLLRLKPLPEQGLR